MVQDAPTSNQKAFGSVGDLIAAAAVGTAYGGTVRICHEFEPPGSGFNQADDSRLFGVRLLAPNGIARCARATSTIAEELVGFYQCTYYPRTSNNHSQLQ
jgi:hypothetical protein